MTRQELAAGLGLSEPAVTGILQRLIAQGLVREGARRVGARYKAAEFTIAGEGAHALGIRFEAGGGEIVCADISGRIVDRKAVSDEKELAVALRVYAEGVAGPPRPLGIGIASHPGTDPDLSVVRALFPDLPQFLLAETEAVIVAERLFGIGEPEGGLVVILIDETVRAGLLVGGKPFRGSHGRAGQIGAMRPGREEASLEEVLSTKSLADHLARHGGLAAEAWVERAASRLLDTVVTIAGFVSPGAVLIGGKLPDRIIDQIIERMAVDRVKREAYFVAAPWIPPVRRMSFPAGGIAYGAALVPFMELLLPKPNGMSP